MFDIFGNKKRQIQVLKLSQLVIELQGVAQQNRIYISQLQKEFIYIREFLNQNHLKIETREEWFMKLSKKEAKTLEDKTNNELAKLQAKTILENEGKPEKI